MPELFDLFLLFVSVTIGLFLFGRNRQLRRLQKQQARHLRLIS